LHYLILPLIKEKLHSEHKRKNFLHRDNTFSHYKETLNPFPLYVSLEKLGIREVFFGEALFFLTYSKPHLSKAKLFTWATQADEAFLSRLQNL